MRRANARLPAGAAGRVPGLAFRFGQPQGQGRRQRTPFAVTDDIDLHCSVGLGSQGGQEPGQVAAGSEQAADPRRAGEQAEQREVNVFDRCLQHCINAAEGGLDGRSIPGASEAANPILGIGRQHLQGALYVTQSPPDHRG